MKLKLTVDGKIYEVDVEVAEPEQSRPSYIPPSGQVRPVAPVMPVGPPRSKSAPDSVADESKVCRSPISGVVVRVPVQVGQSIQANDVLLVLEAMKMETTITAPIAGKVTNVHVKPSDTVQSGQVLVEFA